MSLDQLKAELEKLSADERGEIRDWLDEKELEVTIGRRLAEADADPSIMISHEEVRAHGRAILEKHRVARISSGGE